MVDCLLDRRDGFDHETQSSLWKTRMNILNITGQSLKKGKKVHSKDANQKICQGFGLLRQQKLVIIIYI